VATVALLCDRDGLKPIQTLRDSFTMLWLVEKLS
jgi:hypothetical protein